MTTKALDRPKCGSRFKNRPGKCKQPAGHRTAHPGEGKCWLHGGQKPEGDKRVTHGRRSSVRPNRVKDLAAEHAKNPDPLNLMPELAMLRALLQDYIERYDETTEALLAWHVSWQVTRRPLPEEQLMAFEAVIAEWENALALEGENATEKQHADVEGARAFVKILRGEDLPQRPRQLPDVASAHQIIDTISRVVKRVEDSRTANAISRPELYRVIGEMGRVVDALVPDPAARAAIVKGWNAIAF